MKTPRKRPHLEALAFLTAAAAQAPDVKEVHKTLALEKNGRLKPFEKGAIRLGPRASQVER